MAIRYNIRQKSDDAGKLFSVALVLSALLGVLAIGVGLLFIPRWLVHYPLWAIQFGQAMMFFAPLISVNILLQGFLEARGDFTRSNAMIYIPTFGTLVSLVVLYCFHAITAITVPLAYEIPFSCITIVTLYQVRKEISVPSDFVRRSGLLLNFGLRAYGLDVLATLSAQVGQVLVVGLLSATSFGLFAVALNVSRALAVVGTSLNTVLFPKASELDSAGAIEMVSRSARLIFVVNITVGACLIAAMPFLVRLAYGGAYVPVVRVAQILTCEVILGATISTLTQAFMSTGRPGIVTLLQAVGLGTTFPLMLVLIPKFGLVGAAYAMLVSTVVRFALVLASYPMILRHAVPRLLLTGQDVRDIRARFARVMTG
jgi:O-antigen/teichoic acid export membrane protein